MKSLFLILFLTASTFSQAIIPEDSTVINLCWNGSADTSTRYIVQWRQYGGSDTAWRIVNVVNAPSANVIRTHAMRGLLVWGVRSVQYGDTSALHTSLDNTACTTGDACEACSGQGAWVMKMRPVKPSKIGRKR